MCKAYPCDISGMCPFGDGGDREMLWCYNHCGVGADEDSPEGDEEDDFPDVDESFYNPYTGCEDYDL